MKKGSRKPEWQLMENSGEILKWKKEEKELFILKEKSTVKEKKDASLDDPWLDWLAINELA